MDEKSPPMMDQVLLMPYAEKEKQREYARRWLANRRAAYLAGKRCVLCGSTQRLEIDHADPRQKVSHRVWSWSESRRQAELHKCRVLCRECHEKRHADEKRTGFSHGTTNGYSCGCRCQHCLIAMRDCWKRYNAKKRGRRDLNAQPSDRQSDALTN